VGVGGAGVSNSGLITTLSNNGSINGGVGGGGALGGAGGAGVSNSGLITTLSNAGSINGGAGGGSTLGGVGGAGVSNTGTITTLTNNGTIAGGAGGPGAAGGAGLANAGTIGVKGSAVGGLTNSGKILGGAGGSSGMGGAGLANSGTISAVTNSGTIQGGQGGRGFSGAAGGVGVENSGTITTLTNKGTISGGAGGAGSIAGATGAGVSNLGTITTLTNSGTITGSIGVLNTNVIGTLNNLASGHISGAQMGISNLGLIGSLKNAGLIDPPAGGFAILSTGSIGPITNTGQIVGNVEIDNQANVTVNGGRGKFGSWGGGVITIGEGSLTFASGKTALSDDIVVNGGANGGPGTVVNGGVLMFAASQTITGNFYQSATGALDFGLAGDMTGQYGSLAVTGLASLGGGLGLDLTNGFTLGAGETFDLMGYSGLSGAFTGVSVDGSACSARSGDVWFCRNVGLNLDLGFTNGALDLTVASGAAAASGAIPEPATWAMLALGFLGLGGFGLKGRRKAAALAENL
jgi:hypothetical protein